MGWGSTKKCSELTAKNYRFMKPGLEREDDRWEVTVTDPFNNRITFSEPIGKAAS